jgi:hypothetical protein
LTQLGVHQWQQLLGSNGIALINGSKNAGDFATTGVYDAIGTLTSRYFGGVAHPPIRVGYT